MADGIDDSKEALLLKHKKERKELLSKIQGLKKTCAKGDKKKKKELAEEISALECTLDQRQNQEIKDFESVQELPRAVTSLEITNLEESTSQGSEAKVSKAQRRREKKANKDKERELQIAEQEEINKLGPRHIEEVRIKQLLALRNLSIHEVPSDGNCLYFAIAHQLTERGEITNANVPVLRKLTADYLRAHEADLKPFTSCPNTGCELSEEQYSEYCNRTENNSSEWGGQLELQALSEALKNPIEVIQAEGSTVALGEQYKPQPPIILTYHRHAFGLGEHYNSVTKGVPQDTTDI